MFDGDVAGFLRMSGRDDGTGESQRSNGDYKSRSQNRDRHYWTSQGVDPETGEVLDYKPPKNAKNPYKVQKTYTKRSGGGFNLRSLSYQLPKPAQAMNILLLGAMGYGGWLLYKKFLSPLGNSALEDAKDDADKTLAKSYVDTRANEVKTNQALSKTLSDKGLMVGAVHQKNATLLHDLMDVAVVDHDKIIAVVKGMSIPTFQLTAIAYGTRSLTNYAKAITHLFTTAAWADLFKEDKAMGSLKFHLTTVLTSSEQSKISQYLSSV